MPKNSSCVAEMTNLLDSTFYGNKHNVLKGRLCRRTL